ncbi:DUF4865 family protein [Kitasatospora sp. LaBMicrA B282]|uniref:DUF4865 family protein n=1 Tax=Kitasatospora sp. LaBMicrA B282 TaxID=3420949 RepID=UPI003D095B9D
MQYSLTLPADYDMAAFRERILGIRHVYDDLPGLGLKAYLWRERGVAGSPVNQYALFYLWHDAAAMAHFLTSADRFGRIADFAGRIPVHSWTSLATTAGPARTAQPTTAARRVIPFPPATDGTDGQALIDRELAALADLAGHPTLHTAALVLDPHTWHLVRFTLWSTPVPPEEAATAECFEVLHVSTPDLDALPEGRAW